MSERLRFSEFVQLAEQPTPNFPPTMLLKRQVIRSSPTGLIAVYKDFNTGLLFPIPQQWLKK